MINISVLDSATLLAYWLCFTRWITILITMPVFSEKAIPGTVKMLFCVLISYALFPFAEPAIMKDIAYTGEVNFWFLTIYYALSGLIIGFLAKMIMTIFVSAGSIITQQIGFSSITYFDPSYAAPISPIEQLIRWTLLIMIISSGALLPIFKGVVLSFESFSLYKIVVTPKTFEFLNMFFKDLIKMALLLAMPILVTNLLINSVLGIVARFVPQMNVFMISFVVNIGFGLLVFYFIGQEFFYYSYQMYVDKLGDWFNFVI